MPTPARAAPEDRCAAFDDAGALLRAPADRPIAAFVSAAEPACDSHGDAWTRLGEPVAEITLRRSDFATGEPADRVLRRSLRPGAKGEQRVGWLSYELGRALEPAACAAHAGAAGDVQTPIARFAALDPCPLAPSLQAGGYSASPLVSDMGATAYCSAVERAVRLIHEGDLFQVNVAHRMRSQFTGSARRLFVDLVQTMAPAFAAYIESPANPGEVILSLSPELFLAVDGVFGSVVTKPIKGTLPADQPPGRLAASAKDAAELAMIVDLMRNDLGRVCSPGSVRVVDPRAIERAGGSAPGAGVWHGVATVAGALAPGRDLYDLLAAAFPAGSITGAPKVRAMQRIDQLEPFDRGPCFGAIGTLDGAGGGVFNVAIRTAVIRGQPRAGCFGELDGALELCVGAGVVADSDPDAEWRETLAKAQAFTRLARSSSAGAVIAPAGSAP